MALAWPSSVPFSCDINSLTETDMDVLVRFKPDWGIEKLRPRSTAFIATLSYTKVLTTTQWDALMTFFRTDCRNGALSFSTKHPRTQAVIVAQFSSLPSMKTLDSALAVQATIQLTILPQAPPPEPLGFTTDLMAPVTFMDTLFLGVFSQLYSVSAVNMQTLVDQAGPSGSDALYNNSRFRPCISRYTTAGLIDTGWGAFGRAILEDYQNMTFNSHTSSAASSYPLTSLVWSAGVVTATASAGLSASGAFGVVNNGSMEVTITGASPAAFNGRFLATVTGGSTFTYPLTPAPSPTTATVPGGWVRYKIIDMVANFLAKDPVGKLYMPFYQVYSDYGDSDFGLAKWKTDGTLDETWGFLKFAGNQPFGAYGAFFRGTGTTSGINDGSGSFGSARSLNGVAVDTTGVLNQNGNAYVSTNAAGGSASLFGFRPTGRNFLSWRSDWFPDLNYSACVCDASGNVIVSGSTLAGFLTTRLIPGAGSVSGGSLADDHTDLNFGPALAISSMSWAATAGGTVTFTTTAPHGLKIGGNGGILQIQGVTPSGYNGTNFVGHATGASTITYPLAVNPGSSATVQGTYKTGMNHVVFGQSGQGVVSKLLIDAAGRFLILGSRPDTGASTSSTAMARLNSDGTTDTSFGTSGTVLSFSGVGQSGSQNQDQGYRGGFLDAAGNIILGVRTFNSTGNYFTAAAEWATSRFTPGGALDSSFNGTGHKAMGSAFWQPLTGDATGVAQFGSSCLDPATGNYYLGGHINGRTNNTPTSVTQSAIVKLLSDGSGVDNSWGPLSNSPGLRTPFQGGVTPPSVITGAVTSIGQTFATANATINPNGNSTQWIFLYGLASGLYHYKSAMGTAGSGSSPIAVNIPLTGLTSGVTYFGRAVAYSAVSGLALDAGPTEVTFTTATGGQGLLFNDNFDDVDNTQLIGYHFSDTNLIGNSWYSGSAANLLAALVIQSNELNNDASPGGGTPTIAVDCHRADNIIITAQFKCVSSTPSSVQDFEIGFCGANDGTFGGTGYAILNREGALQIYKDGTHIVASDVPISTFSQNQICTMTVTLQRPNVTAVVTGQFTATLNYSAVDTDASNTRVGIPQVWAQNHIMSFKVQNRV